VGNGWALVFSNMLGGISTLDPNGSPDPLPKPYNAKNGLALKEIHAEFKVVHAAIDEAIETVLNEAAKKVLKKD
jgi:hypothetical protein